MDCAKCRENMHDLLDGELSEKIAGEIRAHIDTCPACSEEFADMKVVRELLSELRGVKVPQGQREAFIEALKERIDSERKTGLRKVISWKPALIAAVFIIASIIVVVALPSGGRTPVIEPASGLNMIDNMKIDMVIMGALDDHFLATTGDFMSDPSMSGGSIVTGWRVMKNTHSDLFEPVE